MLEDVLVGVRRDGLSIQRSSVSIASVVANAMKQVRASAEARRVSFGVATQPDVAAPLARSLLTRSLLTRSLVKLMDRAIDEAALGAAIDIVYRLERGAVTIAFVRNTPNRRDLPSSSPPRAREGADSDLEFCHLVAECHGGTLTIGTDGAAGATMYRFELPWVA